MNIQWYPGHMAKAMRMLEENLKNVDVVIYILDARAPYSCINENLDAIIGDKPVLYVLTKADLASETVTKCWINHLSKENCTAIAINAALSGNIKIIVETVKELAKKRIEFWNKRGVSYTPKAMVIGVPNSGKSTLINFLCGSAKTKTGDKAGVTRGKQWVKINDKIELLDTPGTLPKKFNDEKTAINLAILGSIKDEITDTQNLSFNLIKILYNIDPQILIKRYKITVSDDIYGIFTDIGKARGFLLKGAEIDGERTSNAIIDDFRKGRLGRITLEKPVE